MKNILIIGGSGFIGRNVTKFLLERKDCFVTVADITNLVDVQKFSDVEDLENLKIIVGDFTSINSFKKLDNHYDEIYMLAAVVGVNRTLKNPDEVIRINTNLTMNTLEWVQQNSVKKIVFSSSSENYAGTSDLFNWNIPTDEKVPLCISDIKHPRWTYAMTKMHGESAFLHCAKSYGYECTIVRYQNIIGPNMGFGHAIPHIVQRFLEHRDGSFKVYGHDQTRAFCYIDDAVKGTISAMESKKANGEIYHIGKEQEITMTDLTTYIGNLMGFDGEYENALTYPGSVSRRCPDISKAKKDFEYNPEIDWQIAVKNTVEWYIDFFSSNKIPSGKGFESPEEILRKI